MPDCYHHEFVVSIEPKVMEPPEWNSLHTTYRDVLERAREEFGTDRVAVHLPEDFYAAGSCTACGKPWELFRLRSTYMTRGEDMKCPACGEGAFSVEGADMYGEIDFDWKYLDEPLAKVGARPLDVLKVVKYDEIGVPEATRYWEVSGDATRYGLPASARPASAGVAPAGDKDS